MRGARKQINVLPKMTNQMTKVVSDLASLLNCSQVLYFRCFACEKTLQPWDKCSGEKSVFPMAMSKNKKETKRNYSPFLAIFLSSASVLSVQYLGLTRCYVYFATFFH